MRRVTMTLFLLFTAVSLAEPARATDITALYFFKQGCSWCELFDRILHDKYVSEILARKTRIVRIDIGERPEKDATGTALICAASQEEKQTGTAAGQTARHLCPIPEKTPAPPALAGRYRVRNTPTMIFLAKDGKELLRIPGYVNREDFLDLLCNHVLDSAECRERQSAAEP